MTARRGRPRRLPRRGRRRRPGARPPAHQRAAALPRGGGRAGRHRAQQDRRHGAAAAGRTRGVRRDRHRLHHRPARGRPRSASAWSPCRSRSRSARRSTSTASTSRSTGSSTASSAATGVPRSSQPAVADFAQTYRRLLEYREGVVSVHIAGAMSGTVQAARAAAREVDPRRVRVIDSCLVSIGAGLLLEAVGEAIAAGADLDEIERVAERVKGEISDLRHRRLARLRRARRAREPARWRARSPRCTSRPSSSSTRPARRRRAAWRSGFDRALNAIVEARRALRRRRAGPRHGRAQRRPGGRRLRGRPPPRAPRRRRPGGARRRRAHHARRPRLRRRWPCAACPADGVPLPREVFSALAVGR